MALKKQPNKKSTEELLEILNNSETSKEDKIDHEEDTIITFLRFYNIEPGNQKILDSFLLKLYNQFTKNPVSSRIFVERIAHYIPYVIKYNNKKYYLISQKALNLSEKAYEFVKNQNSYPKHRSINWKLHFENFLKKYDIKSGKNSEYLWISFKMLYNLYDKWIYEIKKKQWISEREFSKLCKIYFTHKNAKSSLWFKIDESISNKLTKDMMSELKARTSSINEKEKKQKK